MNTMIDKCLHDEKKNIYIRNKTVFRLYTSIIILYTCVYARVIGGILLRAICFIETGRVKVKKKQK